MLLLDFEVEQATLESRNMWERGAPGQAVVQKDHPSRALLFSHMAQHIVQGFNVVENQVSKALHDCRCEGSRTTVARAVC